MIRTVELFIRMKSRIVLITRIVSVIYGLLRNYACNKIKALLQELERWRQHRKKEAEIRKLLAVLKSIPKTYQDHVVRPLSPHLPIYKPQLTSTFPISHRISGAFLATIVLFFYILCLKMALICFTYANFYQLFFYEEKLSVGITAFALSYHLYNGLRHLLTRNMARKGNPISGDSLMSNFLVRISIVVLFPVCSLFFLLLGLDLSLIWVKLKSMLLLRSFRFLFSRLLGEAVGPIIYLLCLLSTFETSTFYMQGGPVLEIVGLQMMPSGSGSEVSSSEASVNQTGAGPSNARTDDSSSAPSALEERTNELIQENEKERKGDLGDGQRVSEVRQAVEEDFEIGTKAEEFTLIKEFEAEAQGGSKRNIQEDLPATKSVFNQVKEFENGIQDGGKPNFFSNQEKDE